MERNMRCSCGIGRVSLSGINSNYLKLLSAVIVALFLAVPYLQKQSKSSFSRAKKRGQKEAIGQ